MAEAECSRGELVEDGGVAGLVVAPVVAPVWVLHPVQVEPVVVDPELALRVVVRVEKLRLGLGFIEVDLVG